MSTAPTRPAGRYGDPGPWRRRLRRTAVVLVAAAALGWLLWVALAQAEQGVRFETQGHDVLDDSRVLVTFSVTQRVGGTARCHVQALSSGAAQVGLAVVDVGPSAQRSTTQRVTVRTQQRAVTGSVVDCAPR